ncbi:hypothetical protein AVEN_199788-2 [Araneus ventricosus]|uniref:Uncharacterized protein n=1 Tax=Araneus ventricosus TaxID=182803 RepID=A0A4Y2J0V9_ARAVE|nr:hypothetical protein AVEN_199788-2 [Araneus ventricosus]
MAASLWEAARKMYCEIPYVEWKEAYFGKAAAICQFIVATFFDCFESVWDSIVGLFFPPLKENLFLWIWKNAVEFSEDILLPTVYFIPRAASYLFQTLAFWISYVALYLLRFLKQTVWILRCPKCCV